MLEQFIVENFKTFRDETVLDLRAAPKLKEYKERPYDKGNSRKKEEILTCAVLYGANASGKSNLFDAIKFMRDYVLNSFSFENLNDINNHSDQTLIPFWLDKDSRNKPSKFEIYFFDRENKKTYCFGFKLKENMILEEWLYVKAKTSSDFKLIFERDKNHVEYNLKYINKKQQENLNISLQSQSLLVSLGSKLNIEILKFVRDWFKQMRFINFGNIIEQKATQNSLIYNNLIENDLLNTEFLNFINSFEPTIKKFQYVKFQDDNIWSPNNNSYKNYLLYSVREDENGNEFSLPFYLESEGTQKMAGLFLQLKEVINTGGILIIDELSSQLHQLLLRNVLRTFLLPELNKNHAQIIFTSHDTWLLKIKLFRRDEIWFTQKESDYSTNLYSLYDYSDENNKKIRMSEDIQKNYLIGKYGAIPELEDIGFLKN